MKMWLLRLPTGKSRQFGDMDRIPRLKSRASVGYDRLRLEEVDGTNLPVLIVVYLLYKLMHDLYHLDRKLFCIFFGIGIFFITKPKRSFPCNMKTYRR